jgi:1,2-diacylglycerol 3-alpha-glucosyltransferase
MRIAVFTDTFLPQRNGVVTAICDTLECLQKNHQLTVFAPGKKTFRVEKRSKNLKVVKVPSFEFSQYDGYRISKAPLKKIAQVVERENFDIIHIHTPFTLGMVGIAMSRLFSIPIVGSYHTLLSEYFPHITKGKFYKVMKRIGEYPSRKFTKFIYSKLNCAIAPSSETAKLLRGCEIKRVVCLPNGIKLEKFKFNRKALKRLRKRYGIPKGKKIVLYVGRISFEKKLGILLKAFKMIEKKDIFLLIVGSGPYLKKYRKMAKELKIKNIRFTGFVKDELLPAVYHCADILASPSDTETQGLTFIEAMVCGLPLIGVRRGGAKDIIIDKKNGFLIRPDSPSEMAKKIKILIENERLARKMGRAGQKMVKRYSIEAVTDRLLELYKKMEMKEKEPHPFFKLIDVLIHPEIIKEKIRKSLTL